MHSSSRPGPGEDPCATPAAPSNEPREGGAVFVAWACADIVSVLGSRLASLAIPWFVLTTTGSATQTGTVVLAELAPMILTKALAGPVLDRIGPARGASRLDMASALVAVAIPLTYTADLLSFPLLLALVAVFGALRGPADAGKYALVPDVARVSRQPLERVTGVAGTTERLASSVGAAGGGLLIALVGAAEAVMATAAGFVVSALLIRLVIAPRITAPHPSRARGRGGVRAYLQQLRDGWAFLQREPVLRAIAVLAAVTNMLDQAWVVVLVPVWATRHGHGADAVGLVFGSMTAAAVIGALIAAGAGARMPRLPVYIVGYLAAGLPRYLVFAFDMDLVIVLGVLVVAGLGSGTLNPIISAVQFERTPAAVVGRVSSLVTAMSWALMPFGGLLVALLLSHVGLSTTLIAMGAAYLIATLSPLVIPAFRAIDRAETRNADVMT